MQFVFEASGYVMAYRNLQLEALKENKAACGN